MNEKLDRARAKASENIDKASRRAKEATAKASEKINDARDKAGRAVDATNRIVTEHPLASVAAAVAVGAVAAYLFPRSAKSIRAAAPRIAAAAASARREVTDAARAGVEKASELASTVGEQVESGIAKSAIVEKASETASKIAAKLRNPKA